MAGRRTLPALAVCALLAAAVGASAAPIVGPFQSSQRTHQMSSAHFYVHNATGAPFTVRVRCLSMVENSTGWVAFDRLMVRAFDVEERRIFRAQITAPDRAEQQGVPSEVSIGVPASAPGVVQVVITGGRTPITTFDLTTDPPLPFGVMDSIRAIMPPGGGIEEGFIYVPEGARQLHVTPTDVDLVIRDETGCELLRDAEGTIPVERTGVVWRISAMPRRWPGAKVIAEGFPVIVCPDEATARTIGASVETLDDGSIVAHKFQMRLDRLVRETFSDPEDLALSPIESFAPMTDVFLSDPGRFRHLLVEYGPPLPFVNFWAQRQVLDATSPYFGGVHMPVAYSTPLTAYTIPGSPLNPVEAVPPVPPLTDESLDAPWTGFSPRGYVGSLAFMYNLDPRVNPWYHDPALLRRVIIGASRDLMLLAEDELIHHAGSDWPGNLAFIFRYQICDPYGWVGQAVRAQYPEIYREWTEGITRLADRLVYMTVFSPANQGAHIPYGLWQVYEGSGDEFHAQMSRYSAGRLCDLLQKPAGYQVEGYGPCASYNGITLDLFAMLYAETGDEFYRESIRKVCFLFNHTVAAEPSGRLIGATDLNHRVRMPWTFTQHGGGRRIMAPHLPEVGLWYRDQPPPEEDAALLERIRAAAAEQPYSIERCGEIVAGNPTLAGSFAAHNYLYHQPGIAAGGRFPFEEEPFFRNLGDEFICVRQPAYYTMIYVGKPGRGRREQPFDPTRDDLRTGGGISLLWTPDYYVALAAQGWNAWCHQGVIAEVAEGEVHTAEYSAVEFDADEGARTLDVRGAIEGLPLSYAHSYRFGEDRIAVQTQVEAAGEVAARACVLQFPLFAAKERGFHCEPPPEPTQIVRITDDTGAGVELRFAEPVRASMGVTTPGERYVSDYEIRQLRVGLPARWAAGDAASVTYEIIPFPVPPD